MIEGFKLRVTSKELVKHCLERSVHHERRATEKMDQLPKIKDAVAAVRSTAPAKTVSAMNKSPSTYEFSGDDAIERLESDIRDHQNKALIFAFYAGHLFDEDYTLLAEDLVRLEMLKR